MIGFLTGTVALRNDPYIYVDVHGVGYKVLTTLPVLTQSQIGSPLTIYTYTYVREDALELFGFLHPEDLVLFEHLIGISGIGPKTAIQIFSFGSRTEIIDAIAGGNVAFFTAVPRLGKKNAQKIIIELGNKFSGKSGNVLDSMQSNNSDVVDALKQFGYTPQEITQALKTVQLDNLSPEQQIKEVLKYFNRK